MKILGLILILLSCLTAGQAFARDEMIIGASRRMSSVQDVPIAITAISSESLEKLQIVEVKDIGAMVPNLQTYTVTANGAAMQVHARGASVQNPGFITSESPVGLYVDDVYNGRLATANLDLLDVERIEVLRGPQGTLYGRNTSAGAIKIVTRTPGDDFYADGKLGYGNYETSTLGAALGGPLIPGNLAGSLAGSYQNRGEGYFKNPIDNIEVGEYENTILRGKLHWYLLDNFKATLTGWYVDAENDGYNGVPYDPFDGPGASTGNPLGRFYDNYSPALPGSPNGRANYGETEQSGFSLDWTWTLAGMDLRSITAYSDIDDDFGFDLAGGGFFGVPGLPGLLVGSESNMKQLSQEFHLLGSSFNESVDWIFGFFYLNEDGDQRYTGISAPFVDFAENSNAETESYAVFGEATWQFSEKWSAIFGVRYTDEEKEFDLLCGGIGGGAGTCIPGANGLMTDQKIDFDETNAKIGLNFQLNENQMLYLSAASGFKAGGFQTLCFGNVACADNNYDPEDVISYELGYKSAIGNLQLNTAVFFAQYEDVQQTVITGGAFPTDNIGDADVWGIELDSNWVVTDGLNVFLNAGYMKDDLKNLNPASGAALAGAQDLPSRPDFNARLGFDYTIQIGSDLDLFLGSDLQHVDDYFAEATNSLMIDSYTRLNGFIGIGASDGQWQVTLDGKNLTDADDNVSGIYSDGFANIRTVLPPREIMLNLRLKY